MYALVLAALISSLALAGSAKDDEFTRTPFLDQSFFFDWTTLGFGSAAVGKLTGYLTGNAKPDETAAQCDSLNLSWSRGSDAKGPNPQAPYFLAVYTSAFVVPFSIYAGSGQDFSWPVPFNPGTQFQICMYDSQGNTGGCQRQITVVPAKVNNPVCTNLTYPHSAMDVQGLDATGPISQYGWPTQCSDIQLTPKNGTPPFTMTVAPSLHPPYNITSNSMDPINWTVSLSWGSPFWISLIDSEGSSWTNGPMHAGGGGTTVCLAPPFEDGGISPYAAVGAGVGGLIAGLLVGLLGAWWLSRRASATRKNRRPSYFAAASTDSFGRDRGDYAAVPTPGGTGASTLVGATSMGHLRGQSDPYKIEPWVPPASARGSEYGDNLTPEMSATPYRDGPEPSALSSPPTPNEQPMSPNAMGGMGYGAGLGPRGSFTGSAAGHGQSVSSDSEQRLGQVYVVHHDGGRAPVTVYTADGTEVVELPPTYEGRVGPPERRNEGSSSGGGPGLAAALQQQRRPGGVRKASRVENPSNAPNGPR